MAEIEESQITQNVRFDPPLDRVIKTQDYSLFGARCSLRTIRYSYKVVVQHVFYNPTPKRQETLLVPFDNTD